jgi:hypothetical protein
VAVIQISRIQVRRGVADLSTPSGLPQLASGEIGWAVDQQKLWIGSGSVEEGAPELSNIEILTVPSLTSILATFTASNYSYKLNLASGGGLLGVTQRTIQDKLDDRVSASDFGITSGANVTAQLQKAIDSLYKTNTATTDAPVLEFLPGNYNLTGTVYIPSNVKIHGIGGRTTFTMLTTSTIMFQTVGINQWGTYTTGLNISDSVEHVSLKGLKFQFDAAFTSTNVSPMLALDKVKNSVIEDCEFIGPYYTGARFATLNSGIVLRYGIDPNDNTNVILTRNRFENLCYGIKSDDRINGVKITDSKFYDNYRSIALAETAVGVGPRNVHITDNHFDKVFREAIYVGSSTSTNVGVVSSNNVFRDVGNETTGPLNDTGNGVWPVITFKSVGNVSTNDQFERFEKLQPILDIEGNPDALPTYVPKALIDGPYSWTTRSAKHYTIAPSNLEVDTLNPVLERPLAVVPYVTSTNAVVLVDYIVNRKIDAVSRVGKLVINLNTSTGVTIKDEFSYQGANDGGLTFTGTKLDSSLVINYLINNTATVTLNITAIQ